MSSPPLTPVRHHHPYMASTETSPAQRRPLGHARRSSSFSSNRPSPTRPRSSYSTHRLSNASRYSNAIHDMGTPLDGHGLGGNGGGPGGGGGGNLADELEFADEDEDGDWDESGLDEGVSSMSLADEVEGNWNASEKQSMMHDLDRYERDFEACANADGARDSGIDVVYPPSPSPLNHTLTSQPQSRRQPHGNSSNTTSKRADVESSPDLFTLELEDAMAAVSRLASTETQPESASISSAVEALQNLAPQSVLESHTQRLITSTNSLSSHLTQKTRTVASLSSSLFPPIGLATPLSLVVIEELIPQMDQVLQNLPPPDSRALQGVAKLDRETADLLHTLAGLTDSLQMGKQATASAARHLRNTLTMVTQLRKESDAAEQAKYKIEKEGWDRRLGERWCASECSDVIGGFEQACEGFRRGLEESAAA